MKESYRRSKQSSSLSIRKEECHEKKLNIAMLTMLLVFQTLLSPLSVFASEDLSTPPVVNDNGSDDEMEKIHLHQ